MLKIRLFWAVPAALAAGFGVAYGQPFSRSAVTPALGPGTSPFASFDVINNAAVDGSTVSLRVFEGGLSRVIVTPSGTTKKTKFILLNDRLGTVSEGEGKGNVIGLFVLNQTTISTAYADGRSEVLVSNADGSFSIVVKNADGVIVCASWYPVGHHFSAEEREAALARVCDPSRP